MIHWRMDSLDVAAVRERGCDDALASVGQLCPDTYRTNPVLVLRCGARAACHGCLATMATDGKQRTSAVLWPRLAFQKPSFSAGAKGDKGCVILEGPRKEGRGSLVLVETWCRRTCSGGESREGQRKTLRLF